MKLGTFYIVDFYDIKCEMGVPSSILTENEINLSKVRTIGRLVKKSDLQITLSTFFNLDKDDNEDEDFVHMPIGCIYEIHKLSC
jgi:hypothetical protein